MRGRNEVLITMALNRELLDDGLLVIVGAVYAGVFRWYASTWDMWFLQDWLTSGRTTADLISELAEDEVAASELRSVLTDSLPARSWNDIEHLGPSLYVDFDNKHLTSIYWDGIEFELMVPVSWESEFDPTFRQGQCDRFLGMFPSEERYWIIDNHDVFRELIVRECS